MGPKKKRALTKVPAREASFLEHQRQTLIEANALKMPLLHHRLIEAYGQKKGQKIYEDIYELGFKERAARVKGYGLADILAAELAIFPVFGWRLAVEEKRQKGRTVWYQRFQKCPHLDAAQKFGLPLPCRSICDQDFRLAKKFKIFRGERLQHMPAGDPECCFKIRRYED